LQRFQWGAFGVCQTAQQRRLAARGAPAKAFTRHGVRKLSIVGLAESGCTDAQIQAVTNQSAKRVAFYRKRASRKILSRAAYAARTKHES
jgi:hypothetical protein